VLHAVYSFVRCGTLTIWIGDQKYLGSCEMWCWSRMERISWTDN